MITLEQRKRLFTAALFAIVLGVFIKLSFLELTSPLVIDSIALLPLIEGGELNESYSEPPYWLLFSKEYQCIACIENASYTAPEELRSDSVKYHQRSMKISI